MFTFIKTNFGLHLAKKTQKCFSKSRFLFEKIIKIQFHRTNSKVCATCGSSRKNIQWLIFTPFYKFDTFGIAVTLLTLFSNSQKKNLKKTKKMPK